MNKSIYLQRERNIRVGKHLKVSSATNRKSLTVELKLDQRGNQRQTLTSKKGVHESGSSLRQLINHKYNPQNTQAKGDGTIRWVTILPGAAILVLQIWPLLDDHPI